MTNRIVIGIDPGITGAIYLLDDGFPSVCIDMPVDTNMKTGKSVVSAKKIAYALRQFREVRNGSYFFVALEVASTRPRESSASALKIGTGFGSIIGVLEGIGMAYCLVRPQEWKQHSGLIGTQKDDARMLAVALYPESAGVYLTRKKDGGRADALMIAKWAHDTEAWT